MVRSRLIPALFLLGAVSLLMLTGCATAPAKTSPEDCLVLIPTVVTNTSGAPFARKYFAQLAAEPGAKPKELPVSDFSSSYLMIVTKKPGTTLVGIRSEVDKSRNFRGPDGQEPANAALPYEPGKVVVADFGIELMMVRVTAQSYSAGSRLITPDPAVKEAILDKFRMNDQNEGWFQ